MDRSPQLAPAGKQRVAEGAHRPGLGTASLAASFRSSNAVKLWVGAAAALGLGIWLLVSGLIGLGKKRQD